jgi:hypothetical protein
MSIRDERLDDRRTQRTQRLGRKDATTDGVDGTIERRRYPATRRV